jgi:hypothetical protein
MAYGLMKQKLIVALLFGALGLVMLLWLAFLAYEGWATLVWYL